MPEEGPQKYGKCKVVKLLGQGATAMVYLAKHEGLYISVAVKVLRRKLSDKRPEYAERFLREARTAAWLEHPNIVRVIDCGVESGYHYMVMDYVDGPNCLEMLQGHPQGLYWQEATRIVQQAAAGLAYAAGRDVVHRDVKPSNIMMDSTGRVRVTDLGLAKLTIKGMVSLTQELHTVGTPNYMSPEQIRSPSKLDLRTDIYSLGATFYHLVTGQPPYSGATPMEVVAHHLSSPLVPPAQAKSSLPLALSSVICKMMAKSPDERYQDYEALNGDLASLLEGKQTMAEGFQETDLGIEDEKELRRLLDELAAGAATRLEMEQHSASAAATAAQEDKGSTELDPFGPGEFSAYDTPKSTAGESTALAQALMKRKQTNKKLVVALSVIGGLVVAGVIVLILMLVL